MAVDVPKKRWTGDRLDGLEEKVDEGFARVDAQFEKVEGKIDTLDSKFDKKFDRLTFWILASAGGIIAALVGPDVL